MGDKGQCVYIPRIQHHTGVINAHDLQYDAKNLYLLNTRFNAICAVSPTAAALPANATKCAAARTDYLPAIPAVFPAKAPRNTLFSRRSAGRNERGDAVCPDSIRS